MSLEFPSGSNLGFCGFSQIYCCAPILNVREKSEESPQYTIKFQKSNEISKNSNKLQSCTNQIEFEDFNKLPIKINSS